MAQISAPAPAAEAAVASPGQMWRFHGCRCRSRLSGQGFLLPLRLVATPPTLGARWALPSRLIPPSHRDFGVRQGEGEHADGLSTEVLGSWEWFPSSWLLSHLWKCRGREKLGHWGDLTSLCGLKHPTGAPHPLWAQRFHQVLRSPQAAQIPIPWDLGC